MYLVLMIVTLTCQNIIVGCSICHASSSAPVRKISNSTSDSPLRRYTPIVSKLNESRSNLMSMFSQLDKYKCGKVHTEFV